MASDLTQLTQTPADLAPAAVAALINSSSGVSIDDLVIDIQPNGQVIITPTQAAYADPSWMYYGHAVATYQQNDLANVFGGIPDLALVPPNVPGTSGDIATLLAEIFDVLLMPSDVVDVPLPALTGGGTLFVLQASPTSQMWKGELSVTLFPTTVETTDLGELILSNVLQGLNPPEPASLQDMITTQIIDALTLQQLSGT